MTSSDWNPTWLPSDLIEWWGQASVVVGNWLYIDGGEIWGKSFPQDNSPLLCSFSINLSSSWNTSDYAALIFAHPNISRVGPEAADMMTRKPTMWYDPVEKSIFRFGGWSYYSPPVAVYSSPVSDEGNVNWTVKYTGGIHQSSSVASFSGFTSASYALWVATPTSYYSLGGNMVGSTDPGLVGLGNNSVPMTGMVEYNFEKGLWTNSSSTDYGGTVFGGHSGFGSGGEGLYVPIFGQEGILVFLGGDAPFTQAILSKGSNPVPMNQITIYDIQSRKFYLQSAGGDSIPFPRANFCAVGAGSSDNSTWEIFIYGGFHLGDINSYGLDKVYILTLPAFRWFEAPAIGGTVRSSHRCQIIGKRQMLSIGGHGNDYDDQDPWKSGMGIFDMSELTWGFNYDANAAAYARPALVTNYYNTSSQFPTFDNASLEAVIKFTQNDSSVTLNNSTSGPSSANTSTSTSGGTSNAPASSQKSKVGAIAGGIAGGVAAAILAILGYLFWRRRQKRQEINIAKLTSDSTSVLPANTTGMHEMEEQRRITELNAGLRPEMDEQRGISELNGGVMLEMDGSSIVNERVGKILR
ncbi:hypothetical protein SS1G_03685 [Sclerotinia sclerotiorum 1980 UF-70]|uniref:Kelch repeat protein n=2 Tax=Sclerotinia sclerotiorum (strain ATCC 18683 / 1980 / Ss-1) TaxID=665079 RepID=A7EEE5_SCLS1|nr:hypothetical protein SS1G_03685 [Sclerotinia sclerotiorum 1980 UF-70]APA12662.1 hypothetical protein sscle_09g074320 [Sclerotinia sclerotiorum 1980 UF-70]EDO01211.1 hypothetical protein SS1G_03685 [Sclerotinia sclerotiorum 1980 UF-70]